MRVWRNGRRKGLGGGMENKVYQNKEGRFIVISKNVNGKWKTKSYPRYVWEQNVGPIPDGFDVHHKDKNFLNNEISNLELVEHKNHCRRHTYEQFNLDYKEQYVKCDWCDREFLWTIDMQRQHRYSSKFKGKETKRFCSKSCQCKNSRAEQLSRNA